MEYEMEDFYFGMEMEWKKIASMEYGKIVFHSVPCPAQEIAMFRYDYEQNLKSWKTFDWCIV